MIKWYSTTAAAHALGYKDRRTFQTNHADKYPPDRVRGKFCWWKEETLEKIKREEFGSNTADQERSEGV